MRKLLLFCLLFPSAVYSQEKDAIEDWLPGAVISTQRSFVCLEDVNQFVQKLRDGLYVKVTLTKSDYRRLINENTNYKLEKVKRFHNDKKELCSIRYTIVTKGKYRVHFLLFHGVQRDENDDDNAIIQDTKKLITQDDIECLFKLVSNGKIQKIDGEEVREE